MRKEIIGNFICCEKHMVVVKLEHGIHVMTNDEWKSIYGKLHPEKWKKVKNNINGELYAG